MSKIDEKLRSAPLKKSIHPKANPEWMDLNFSRLGNGNFLRRVLPFESMKYQLSPE